MRHGAGVVRLLGAGALVLATACSGPDGGGNECDDTASCAMETIPRSDRGNYSLVVSNQSFQVPSVVISVTIDDRGATGGRFDVENQHNFVTSRLELEDGTYRLTAEATDLEGNHVAGLVRSVEVRGRQFGLVTFSTEAEESELRFQESDTPFAFG
jgi:hypothetical protein